MCDGLACVTSISPSDLWPARTSSALVRRGLRPRLPAPAGPSPPTGSGRPSPGTTRGSTPP
eukprot:6282496-Pyramimonas_sp.AAC.1